MILPWLAPPAALGASALAHAYYQAATRRRFPPDGEFVQAGGARVHVLRRGAGTPVMLIHGASASHHDFDAKAPEASLVRELARDHQLMVVDRPGHSHSGRPAGTLDLAANARAVLGVLEAYGAEPAILVGHSYGALVALRAAIDAPERVRAVVAVAPAFVIDARNTRWSRLASLGPLAVLGMWTLPLVIRATVAPRVRSDAWHPATPPSAWTASRAFPFTPAQMQATSENLRHLPADIARLHADLPRLRARLTVLAAEQDRITPWQPHAGAMHEAVAGSRLVVVPGTGHWLFRQEPLLVAAEVRALA
jgi:pimeloyl-ACP methyl ester carboxylesterase